MTWAKFDDNYTDNPKVEEAGPWAELLDMRAIIHCARHETDGFVSRPALRRLGRDIPKVMSKVERLVEVGRWELAPDGWWVHDFLVYNPSKAQREGLRERWREEKAKQRMSAKESGGDSAESPPTGREVIQKEIDECELCDGSGWLLAGDSVRRCEHRTNVVPMPAREAGA